MSYNLNKRSIILEKPKRTADPKLLESYRGRPCVVCAQPGVGHHIKSVGSGGPDADFNLLAACVSHHREVHDKGLTIFLSKYPHVATYLSLKGWQITYTSPGISLWHPDL